MHLYLFLMEVFIIIIIISHHGATGQRHLSFKQKCTQYSWFVSTSVRRSSLITKCIIKVHVSLQLKLWITNSMLSNGTTW